jgi:hypothetical protein
MNAKINKRTLTAGALAAGLIAVLLPTGCAAPPPPPTNSQLPPGSAVVAPPQTVD